MAAYAGEKCHFVGGLGAMTGWDVEMIDITIPAGREPIVGETVYSDVWASTAVVLGYYYSDGGSGWPGNGTAKLWVKDVSGQFGRGGPPDQVKAVSDDAFIGQCFVDTTIVTPAGTTPAYLASRGTDFALADVMNAAGSYRNNGSTGMYVVSNDGGNCKITSGADWGDNLIGQLAYVGFGEGRGHTDGYYEITAKDATSITVDCTFLAADTACIFIGGAYAGSEAGLQSALDNSSAADYNQYILTNADITTTAAIDVDTGHGVIAKNTHRHIIGFNTLPPTNAGMSNGDMDPAGDNYESALTTYQDGNYYPTSGKKVDIDGDGGAWQLINLDTTINVHFRNIYFHNVANAYDLLSCVTSINANTFRGCCFAEMEYINDGAGHYSCLFDDCYFAGTAHSTSLRLDAAGYDSIVSNSVFDFRAASINGYYGLYWTHINNLFSGGLGALYGGYLTHFKNCTFYNQSSKVYYGLHATSSRPKFTNCIFYLAATDDQIMDTSAAGGGITVFENNCYWSAGGALTAPFKINGSEVTNVDEIGSIVEDPDFVDAAAGDFTPQNRNLIYGGKDDQAGNPSQIGIIIVPPDLPAESNVKSGIEYDFAELTGSYASTLPTAPTISVVAGTASAVVTIAGDAGATHYAKYKGTGDTSWQDGGSRSGDGDITISNLLDDVPYIITVYSIDADGFTSAPAVGVLVTLTATLDNTFDDQTETDASVFLDTFGETVTYYPSGGGTRSIDAVVSRDPIGRLDGAPHGKTQHIVVSVANDSSIGISSSEIDTGKDKIELVYRIGETAQQRVITKIVSIDHGMMHLELR